MLTLARYVAEYESFGRRFIAIPAPLSTTGNGYSVGCFEDGSVLIVGNFPAAEIVYTTRYTGPNAQELLEKAGAILAATDQATRARQLEEIKPRKNILGRYILRGLVWRADGSFAGIDGDEMPDQQPTTTPTTAA
jgi:hypothetical protein